MSNNASISKRLTKQKRNKWDESIADAKKKIAGPRMSISVYEIMKAAGDPWARSVKCGDRRDVPRFLNASEPTEKLVNVPSVPTSSPSPHPPTFLSPTFLIMIVARIR